MEQSGNGLDSRMTMDRNAVGVMADSPALIPVVRYNSRLMFITLPKAIIYTLDVAVENQPFHLPIYSYSYLLFIYNNPDGLF